MAPPRTADTGEPEPKPQTSISNGAQASRQSRPSPFGRLGDLTMHILKLDMPRGASGMTAQALAQAPNLTEVQQGAYTAEGEERWLQFERVETPPDFREKRVSRREARAQRDSVKAGDVQLRVSVHSEKNESAVEKTTARSQAADLTDLTRYPTVLDSELHRTESGTYPNGYKFPPKHTKKEALAIGFRAFLRFTFGSVFGFLIVFYAVQIVGWGGMIFILLCGGADSRACWTKKTGQWVVDCSSKHTSKSLWIEIDAQVLTALFCVTAFGLAPWRGRDLWHLLQFRIWGEFLGLRKLAAVHKGWFRLPGSHHLDPHVQCADLTGPPTNFKKRKYTGPVHEGDSEAQHLVPYPLHKGPPAPLTGVRAFPTKLWKMDFVVYMMLLNTIFQIPLCGIMWGQNRFIRPAWATALLIVAGMISGMAAGWVQFQGSRAIKSREGIPHPQEPVKAENTEVCIQATVQTEESEIKPPSQYGESIKRQ